MWRAGPSPPLQGGGPLPLGLSLPAFPNSVGFRFATGSEWSVAPDISSAQSPVEDHIEEHDQKGEVSNRGGRGQQ